jgi:RNA 2',3'-cyclic 3'-phosphodiesterase
MNNLHRIFIAINLSEKLRKELGALQDRWPELPARWAKPENLHVTLVFLGNVNDQEVCDVCAAAAEVGKRHEPFDLTVENVTYGPPKKFPPRLVWATGQVSEELGALQKDLESALFEFAGGDYNENAGYGFSPHVTLARIEQFGLKKMEAEEIPIINEKIGRTFMVESFEVMESELKRGGPVYTILDSVKLGQLSQ